MGKRGPGVSIADHVELERKSIREILDRNGVTGEDRQSIVDSFEEAAYQWCRANALACAMEGILNRKFGEEVGEVGGYTLTAVNVGKMADQLFRDLYGGLFGGEGIEREE